MSVRSQCKLLSVTRSNLYYVSQAKVDNSILMQEIAEIYEKYPIYGYRRMTISLNRKGIKVNKKKVARLMKLKNLRAIFPGPNTSKRNHAEMVYPYLLRGLAITRSHQVWQIDITYLRVEGGFMYLTALIDVFSRMVVGRRLSNDLSTEAALEALEEGVLKYGAPEIINSDQGAQFTSISWVELLAKYKIKISMTGKGRSNDNAHVERLWRTLKYEGIYLHAYKTVKELKRELPNIINWYNFERPHQALDYKTPKEKLDDAFVDNFCSNIESGLLE